MRSMYYETHEDCEHRATPNSRHVGGYDHTGWIMEPLNVVTSFNNLGSWLLNNKDLLLQYTVNLIAALLILIIGSIVAKVISRTANRVMKLKAIDVTVADFLSAIIRCSILAFTIIAVLSRLGVQTTSVIAVIGAAGLAVGLALQGSLSNFAAGVLLVALRPFRVGEYVDLGGVAGTVLQVQIFSTTLRTPDAKIVVVPNGKIISGNIINTTRDPERRTEITLGVAYNADIDVVKKILGDIVAADNRIIHDRGVTIRLNEMAASSLNFIVRVWSSNADSFEVYWDLMENFKRALDANHISIPYPQMDVHLYPPANVDMNIPTALEVAARRPGRETR